VTDTSDRRTVGVGQTLYTADGRAVGTVRGVDEDGVFVSHRDGVASFSVEHVRAGGAFGEAELVWRCTDCGAVGPLDEGLPDDCPDCGAARERLAYLIED
jgi:rubredoxin